MGRIKKRDTTVIVPKRGCEQPTQNTRVVPHFASVKEAQGHLPLCTPLGMKLLTFLLKRLKVKYLQIHC
jgi:hypothetical protein